MLGVLIFFVPRREHSVLLPERQHHVLYVGKNREKDANTLYGQNWF
jgi:hypothetical protein